MNKQVNENSGSKPNTSW